MRLWSLLVIAAAILPSCAPGDSAASKRAQHQVSCMFRRHVENKIMHERMMAEHKRSEELLAQCRQLLEKQEQQERRITALLKELETRG